jgi:hypothetical protein
MTHPRRHGVIEVHRRGPGIYHLTIGGVMWAEVEWSASRQAWCIQDAGGQCLRHVESIHATVADPADAIRLAKRMIVSGEIPTPELAAEAQRQREQQWRSKKLGEPVFVGRSRGAGR